MPALPSTLLLNTLVHRSPVANFSSSSQAVNATGNALQVVCAWPVSGQYGPGSRILYYVLVAACVFARKTEWLRNACLAAALLFPAVAAIHGIVLVALHVQGAVDMDVYGAFQLCSIGILAAPVMVRHSQTYFNAPGRNTIFLWTGLILAGLLSLTVEFYRIKTADCTHDDSGNPISLNATAFPYDENPTCGLTCSVEKGPRSPMRGGSANNIYVIPAPDKLTFGMATLLAAACCIPAILMLISTWNKIYKNNGDEDEKIEGTNGATIGRMNKVNDIIRSFLSVVEILVFSGAVLAILSIGERNFFSHPVRYQTEPMASIGQWAPIVGTGFAALGSLYLLLAADVKAVKEEAKPSASMHHCNCSHRHHGRGRQPTLIVQPAVESPPSSGDTPSIDDDVSENSSQDPAGMPDVGIGLSAESDAGNRRKVARVLTTVGNYLSTAAHNRFGDPELKRVKAPDYPEVPGEEQRNSELRRIKTQFKQRSRAGSSAGSVASGLGIEDSSAKNRAASPQSPHSPRSPSLSPSPATSRRPHASPLQAERTSFELQKHPSTSSAGLVGDMLQRRRRSTLEVPPVDHHNPTRSNPSASSITPMHSRESTVVSRDPDKERAEEIP